MSHPLGTSFWRSILEEKTDFERAVVTPFAVEIRNLRRHFATSPLKLHRGKAWGIAPLRGIVGGHRRAAAERVRAFAVCYALPIALTPSDCQHSEIRAATNAADVTWKEPVDAEVPDLGVPHRWLCHALHMSKPALSARS